MLNKNNYNNFIKKIKFDKRSLRNRIRWIRRKYKKKRWVKFFFNFRKTFLINEFYSTYFYTCFKLKKKRHWWRKIFFKKRFTYYGKHINKKMFSRSWMRYIKKFPLSRNKYILYIRYFYTYKSLKFKNFLIK